MAVVLVMMVVITSVVYFTVKEYMFNEARERYQGVLLKTRAEMHHRLSDVHIAVQNSIYNFEHDIDDPDMMFGHLERMVRQNPSIVCTSLLFEQNHYPSKGRVFILCARKDKDDSVRVARVDSTYHGYFYGEWFQNQLKSGQSVWSKPYFESQMFAGSEKPRLLITYFVPVHNHESRPVALLCADLSLENLRDSMMNEITAVNNKFENGQMRNSYSFIIDNEGTYVMHPDANRILTKLDDKDLINALKSKIGESFVNIDGVSSWIYHRTVKYVDWTIVMVVPKDAILANARGLNIIILLVMIIGMVAIYLFCRYQIRKTTRPLHRFALSADQVALGNFSSPLPEVKGGDEVRLLHDAIANMQTSLSIYVDELEKTTTTKASLERELKIAHDIQMAMLPKTLNYNPSTVNSSIDLYAALTPARDVGGDLYDYFLRNDRLFFCIGDVIGKGVPAALMMAVVRAMFRSEARRTDSAAAIVDTMNRNLSEEYTAGYFVTMFAGVLDLTSGRLDYCNAGHEAPIIAGHPLAVKLNLPVGALPDWNYEGQEVQLQSGDMLFLYTDGLSEAKNTADEQFGRKHVQQLASTHTSDTAQQLVEMMETEVRQHVAGAEQIDDITMLAIRWQQSDSLTMAASMDEISRLEPFIAHTAQWAGIEGREAKRLRLAVEEAVANVINYGHATTITLQAAVEDNQLVLTIDDDGLPFDPTIDSPTDLSVPADERPSGGLGIMLLHEMTDGLNYERKQEHNILKIKKNNEHHN